MDPLFERRELVKKVHIYSKFLQNNMQGSILSQLKMNYEGRCSSEGFIQPNSITILDWSTGSAGYRNGGVDYEVKFQADICLPHQGQIFKAMVNLKSKVGIHAETPPIKVLIPRDLHIGNEEFENVKEDQEIEFEVIGSEFKQQDKNIYVVGRLRSAIKSAALMPLISNTELKEEKPISISTNEDEKLIIIKPSLEAEPKKRKLKKSKVEDINEQTEERMVERTD
jgi:DNA-directed RNA polymerase subunit E'/Rpb7